MFGPKGRIECVGRPKGRIECVGRPKGRINKIEEKKETVDRIFLIYQTFQKPVDLKCTQIEQINHLERITFERLIF